MTFSPFPVEWYYRKYLFYKQSADNNLRSMVPCHGVCTPSYALVRLDHDACQLNRNADRSAETGEADRQDSPDSHTPEVRQSYPKGPTAGLFFLSSTRRSSPLERLGEGEQDESKIVS